MFPCVSWIIVIIHETQTDDVPTPSIHCWPNVGVRVLRMEVAVGQGRANRQSMTEPLPKHADASQ